MDVSARGRYGAGTFWHKDILAHVHLAQGHPCRNVYIALQSAKMYLCWNVLVPKYPCAIMFKCCNVPVLKRPLCQNILMPKCSRAKMFSCRNVLLPQCPSTKKSLWWNVSAEMSLAEMSGAEISPRLFWRMGPNWKYLPWLSHLSLRVQ